MVRKAVLVFLFVFVFQVLLEVAGTSSQGWGTKPDPSSSCADWKRAKKPTLVYRAQAEIVIWTFPPPGSVWKQSPFSRPLLSLLWLNDFFFFFVLSRNEGVIWHANSTALQQQAHERQETQCCKVSTRICFAFRAKTYHRVCSVTALVQWTRSPGKVSRGGRNHRDLIGRFPSLIPSPFLFTRLWDWRADRAVLTCHNHA